MSVQAANQMFVSDAAMEVTLQGRAEYAGILAEFGFLPQQYAMTCNDSGSSSNELKGIHDEYSGNARIIKAAICAGEKLISPLLHCFHLKSTCFLHAPIEENTTGTQQ